MALSRIFPYPVARQARLPFSALAPLGGCWAAWEEAIRATEEAVEAQRKTLQNAFDAALAALPESSLRTAVYNARKAFYQQQRLPEKATLAAWQSHAETADIAAAAEAFNRARHAQEEAQKSFAAQYERVVPDSFRRLQEWAQLPDFQRALLFCSHQLLSCLPAWSARATSEFTKKDRQTAFSVLQYLTRMATRSTPLSRLATVALPAEQESPFLMEKIAVTPESALLPLLYDALLQDPAFYRLLSVRLNPCIVEPASREYVWLFFDGEAERLQRAAADEALSFVAKALLSAGRSAAFEALCAQLAEASEQPPERAERYVLDLLDAGFLEWELPVLGLSPHWCDELYRYLAFLPSTPCIMATLELLQWLRTAARTLPYQPLAEAAQTQQQTTVNVRLYCHRWGVAPPTLPAERLFYEDVASASAPFPAFNEYVAELALIWEKRPAAQLPPERRDFLAFAYNCIVEGHSGHFLELAEAFLRRPDAGPQPSLNIRPPHPRRIGALFQVFEEDGQPGAVLNALYPGGGKLLARWLHLFPSALTETLREWLKAEADDIAEIAFPWQGYSNANLQPPLAKDALAVPGGRTRPLPDGQIFLLSHLAVGFKNREAFLYDAPSGQHISLTDLGLEAPELRPPVLRLLWHIGVPYVSRQALLPPQRQATPLETGVWHWPRHRQGRWVLDRARWLIEPAIWMDWIPPIRTSESTTFRAIRARLARLNIPRHFTAVWARDEEPLFFDADSPLSLQLFVRKLRQHKGALSLREYWPIPEQQAQEWAVEFSVDEPQ
ncbi:MAG: lantibiotic dehydratase [Saprospiraceae bacterium]|nr:lantibiotic dehydratase [Saprospiraceae bacterium]